MQSENRQTGGNIINVIFDSGPFSPLCNNVTSSTKQEVHNVLHCRQRRTKPQIICAENLVKFGCDFEICDRTDRQTDRHADRNT